MQTLDSLGIVHPGVFCAAVLLLNLTPGPDTAFIVGQSVANGRRNGLAAVLGISAGCLVHTAAIALGLSAILAASATAFTIIKVAGAAYLAFLGIRMIVATVRSSERTEVAPARRLSARRAFAQGFVTNILNPKVVLFFLSFFPQFVARDPVDAGTAGHAAAFVVLGAMLVAISTVYNGAVAWLAGSITRRMRGQPRVKRWLDRSIGAAFVALGARLAFADR